MFVAWRADRTRILRRVFLLLCLLPCACLAAWGAWHHGPAHRDAVRRRLESSLGCGISLGGIEHLRPGCVRLLDVVALDDRGGALLRLGAAELEWSADEVRFRTAVIDLDPAVVAAVVRLGRSWLDQPQRFTHDVIVEVERVGVADGDHPVGLRAECVAAAAGRAIRVRTIPESEDTLVVQAIGGDADGPPRVEARGRTVRPLPAAIAAALVGWPGFSEAVGQDATVVGAFSTTAESGTRRATYVGSIDGVDLATCTRTLQLRAEGRVRVDVERCRTEGGRIVDIAGGVAGGPGTVARPALESLAAFLGGGVGPAWEGAAASPVVPFDRLAARFSIDATGVRLEGDQGGGIVSRGGRTVLGCPTRTLSFDRIAWALSPPGTTPVPATPFAGWLLAVLPLAAPGESADARPVTTR